MNLVRHVFCGLALAAFILVTAIASACDPECATVCIKYSGCDGTCQIMYGINFSDPAHPCEPCSLGCISRCNIRGAGTCDSKCGIGYCFIKANSSCVAVAHCNNCTNGTLPCSACAPGYILVDGQCIQCDEHCLYDNCTVSDTCSGEYCDPGYVPVPYSSTPGVYTCDKCGKHCNGTCEIGSGMCDGPCDPGYALNSTVHQCVECSRNCTSGCVTEGPYYCDASCESGYVWRPAIKDPTKHACYPCAIGCLNCNSAGPGLCDTTTAAAPAP
jgi:hypothetical protein